MLRLLLLVVALASTAAAQPRALRLPAVPARTYDDAVHPIGWSPDGRHLAFLYRSSGEGAVGDRLSLYVQDLATDIRVAEQMLTSNEPQSSPDVSQIWADFQPAIRRTLAEHRIGASVVELRPLPAQAPGGPYAVTVAPSRRSGGVAGYTLTMRDRRGRTKTLETQTFDPNPYGQVDGVRAVGVLVAPTRDRVAVVLAISARGYEGAPTVRYRLVGAAVGSNF